VVETEVAGGLTAIHCFIQAPLVIPEGELIVVSIFLHVRVIVVILGHHGAQVVLVLEMGVVVVVVKQAADESVVVMVVRRVRVRVGVRDMGQRNVGGRFGRGTGRGRRGIL
jgi:hypothetical protein